LDKGAEEKKKGMGKGVRRRLKSVVQKGAGTSGKNNSLVRARLPLVDEEQENRSTVARVGRTLVCLQLKILQKQLRELVPIEGR